jgi:hypothetical protein
MAGCGVGDFIVVTRGKRGGGVYDGEMVVGMKDGIRDG